MPGILEKQFQLRAADDALARQNQKSGGDYFDEPLQAALTRLTGATNFSGHPSLTVPCGRTQLGLPVGVQLIGRYWDEALLYQAGQALDDAMR